MKKTQFLTVVALGFALVVTYALSTSTKPLGTQKTYAQGVNEDVYIGQNCVLPDGRGGTCQYVNAISATSGNCQSKLGASYTSVPGYCPGSNNVQCCVAPLANTAGNAGFLAFASYAIDCTNGVAVTAAYQAGSDPTKPPIYYNIELVNDQSQAGLGKGTLIGQDVTVNQGTFFATNPTWYANGQTALFYIYTIPENTTPKESYTIHGLDAGGTIVSRAPDEQPPLPFSLTCPTTPQSPNPPPIVPPTNPTVGGDKTDMTITVRLFLPLGAGTINQTPVLTTLPTVVTVTDHAQRGDDGSQLVDMKALNNGVWEGTYTGTHIPGNGFSVSVKPLNHAKKTFCHAGGASPQVLYSDYECDINEGTIALFGGKNVLDFSQIPLAAGDIAYDERSDGVVDSQDLFAILLTIYKRRPYSVKYDVNLDGTISQADFDLALWSFLNVAH